MVQTQGKVSTPGGARQDPAPDRGASMSKGYVYILTNQAMPGLVKVGMTLGDVEARAAQLHTTGVPMPFEIYECLLCPDAVGAEAQVHSSMPDLRVNNSREFFKCDASFAAQLARDAQREQVSEWLNEFIPDTTIVDDGMVIDDSDVALLASELNVNTYDVVAAFRFMRAEEFRPALDRWYAQVEKRKRARENGLQMPAFEVLQ